MSDRTAKAPVEHCSDLGAGRNRQLRKNEFAWMPTRSQNPALPGRRSDKESHNKHQSRDNECERRSRVRNHHANDQQWREQEENCDHHEDSRRERGVGGVDEHKTIGPCLWLGHPLEVPYDFHTENVATPNAPDMLSP